MKLTDLNAGDRFNIHDGLSSKYHGIILDEPHKAYINFDHQRSDNSSEKNIQFVADLQSEIDRYGYIVVKL